MNRLYMIYIDTIYIYIGMYTYIYIYESTIYIYMIHYDPTCLYRCFFLKLV